MSYEMLDVTNQSIYIGCIKGFFKLSLATRIMNIKTDDNLPKNCMDACAEMLKDYLPEDNLFDDSYYVI